MHLECKRKVRYQPYMPAAKNECRLEFQEILVEPMPLGLRDSLKVDAAEG